MRTFAIAGEILRDAFAGRLMIGIFAAIGAGFVGLTMTLNLDVVEGTLAAGQLFGIELHEVGDAASLDRIFGVLTILTFVAGVLFAIVASADLAVKALAPGRIELLLALPVRRFEIVVGTFLGVITIGVMCASLVAAGLAVVFRLETGLWAAGPPLACAFAWAAFASVYAVMLFVTTIARSTPVAAGAGLIFFIIASVCSPRDVLLASIEAGAGRTITSIVLAPVPRLAYWGVWASSLGGHQIRDDIPTSLVGVSLLFIAAMLAGATYVVYGRDY